MFTKKTGKHSIVVLSNLLPTSESEFNETFKLNISVADPDPGSGAFLTPGSGIRNRFFPDPGSRIPDPYFWELSDNFLGKIICNFVKFVAT